jgi:hypothetical protein
MNGRPALALTSELVGELMTQYIHTEKDSPEITDPRKIGTTAHALYELINNL